MLQAIACTLYTLRKPLGSVPLISIIKSKLIKMKEIEKCLRNISVFVKKQTSTSRKVIGLYLRGRPFIVKLSGFLCEELVSSKVPGFLALLTWWLLPVTEWLFSNIVGFYSSFSKVPMCGRAHI